MPQSCANGDAMAGVAMLTRDSKSIGCLHHNETGASISEETARSLPPPSQTMATSNEVCLPQPPAVAEYEYDGAKRRGIKKVYSGGILDETRHLYYTEPFTWQVVEERVDALSDPDRQFVWGLRYIDDFLLRDRDTTGNGALDERLYGLQDANWNVTSIVDTAGIVQERCVFSAYGIPLFFDSSFNNRTSSSYAWETLFAGYRWDGESKLLQVRNRLYDAYLGTWLQRDTQDRSQLYAYCESSPLRFTDPRGLGICEFLESPITNCACAAIAVLDTALSIATAMTVAVPWLDLVGNFLSGLDCLCDVLSIAASGCCGGDLNTIGLAGNLGSCIFDLLDITDMLDLSDAAQALGEFLTWAMAEGGPDVAEDMGSFATCVDAIF